MEEVAEAAHQLARQRGVQLPGRGGGGGGRRGRERGPGRRGLAVPADAAAAGRPPGWGGAGGGGGGEDCGGGVLEGGRGGQSRHELLEALLVQLEGEGNAAGVRGGGKCVYVCVRACLKERLGGR
jgi:hypothetical protein